MHARARIRPATLRRHRAPSCGVLACALPLLLVAAGPAGCAKPLLTDEEERSQYDRFDTLRNQRAQGYIEDEFGRLRPNLRGRLLPKN